jgi:hypothetical protein
VKTNKNGDKEYVFLVVRRHVADATELGENDNGLLLHHKGN